MEPALATIEQVSYRSDEVRAFYGVKDGAVLRISALALLQCGLCFRLLTRRHRWVELAASLLCSERLFPRVLRRAFPRQKAYT